MTKKVNLSPEQLGLGRCSSTGRNSPCGAAERGSALVEFMLCSLVWLPLLLGTAVIGLNLIRAIQVTQVCRDAGHMYSYGVDFSQSTNQNLLLRLAQGLNITANAGNGVVILSRVTYIGDLECKAGNLQPNTSSCPNYTQIVITNRLTIGNAAAASSSFGTLAGGMTDASGNVSQQTYLTNPGTRATGFSNVINLNTSGQYAYVSEMYVGSPDYNFWPLLGSTGVSARSIF